jgi:hypothetical protein
VAKIALPNGLLTINPGFLSRRVKNVHPRAKAWEVSFVLLG